MIYYRIAGRTFFKFEDADRLWLWGCINLWALIVILLFSGCATSPFAASHEAVARALPWQPGDKGYYFDKPDYDYVLSEGVPASYFTSQPRGYFLSELNEVRAGDLLAAKRNPGVWQ